MAHRALTRFHSRLGRLALGVALAASLGLAADPAKGRALFEQCSVCHYADRTDKKIGPGLKGLFKRSRMSNGKKLTEQNVRAVIERGANGMPAYKDILSPAQIDELVAFLKTL